MVVYKIYITQQKKNKEVLIIAWGRKHALKFSEKTKTTHDQSTLSELLQWLLPDNPRYICSPQRQAWLEF
jgi:phosphoribosyl-AMP cyclohydrolase